MLRRTRPLVWLLPLLLLASLPAALAPRGHADDAFRFTKERQDGELSLVAKEASAREVLEEVGRRIGKTIALDPSLDAKITIPDAYHWKKTEPDQPVLLVAKLMGLEVETSGERIVLRKPVPAGAAPGAPRAAFREFPIGDEVEREAEHMKVAAVWLPPVTMDHDCGPAAGPNVVHLECDVHATRGNTHGFAAGDWIPYMTVSYTIEPEKEGKAISGKLMPMVAKDGPHYGATISIPAHGRYRLVFKLEPPSVNGLGRHTDPVTGVSEWWQAFETSYAWDYKGVPVEQEEKGKR